MNSKERWYDRLDRIYKKADACMVTFSCLTMLISICFDICPLPYWTFIGNFFDYESGNIFAAALTIWTFITVLLIYYLERMNERCYGIRFRDVLGLYKVENKKKFFRKVVVFVVEFFFLIIVSVVHFPITLFTVTVLQFLTMLYVLLMVYINTSETMVLQKVEGEFLAVMQETNRTKKEILQILYEKVLLIQMVSNLDFSQTKKDSNVIDILCQEAVYNGNNECQKYVLRELATIILNTATDEKLASVFINHWICSCSVLDEYKGELLFPFIERGIETDFVYCEKVAETLKERQQRKIITYCIARNKFLSKKVDQSYRIYYINRMETLLGNVLTEDDEKYIIKLKIAFEKEEGNA